MFLAKLFVKINFISLVNLILNKEVVKELIQSDFNKKMIKTELNLILKGKKNQIQKDYKDLRNFRTLKYNANQNITGSDMVNFLDKYAEIGFEYVIKVKNIIEKNQLSKYENSILTTF